jgi:hypothetical protein
MRNEGFEFVGDRHLFDSWDLFLGGFARRARGSGGCVFACIVWVAE